MKGRKLTGTFFFTVNLLLVTFSNDDPSSFKKRYKKLFFQRIRIHSVKVNKTRSLFKIYRERMCQQKIFSLAHAFLRREMKPAMNDSVMSLFKKFFVFVYKIESEKKILSYS